MMLETIADWLSQAGQFILSLFPDSPFTAITRSAGVGQVLGWLNWVMPFGEMLSIMQAWLSCIAVYYCWMAIGRALGILE